MPIFSKPCTRGDRGDVCSVTCLEPGLIVAMGSSQIYLYRVAEWEEPTDEVPALVHSREPYPQGTKARSGYVFSIRHKTALSCLHHYCIS